MARSNVRLLTAALSCLLVGALPNTGRAQRPDRGAPAGTDRTRGAGSLDSTLAVATFDSAWATVGASLERRGVTRLDWDAVRRELRPAAAQASSDSALRRVIGEMLSRVGESHFAILPARSNRGPGGGAAADALGTAGLDVRLVDGTLAVWRVDRHGPAHAAGVVAGLRIDRIDDNAATTLGAADTSALHRLAVLTEALRALRGAPGSTLRLTVRSPDGAAREIAMVRDTLRGPMAQFGNLPPLPATFELSRRATSEGRCIGVIRFAYWLPPIMPAFDRAVDSLRTCAGIVLDLRGNLGGVAGMMMGVAGHFLNEPRTLGVMRTRGNEMRFVANPRRVTDAGMSVAPFAGPLAILVDGLSASTSEMFAAALQALGRARVFGERSAAQALPAVATTLPNGDVLMHVVADFEAPDGTRVEGRGVVPDEPVPLTWADLRAERDAPLEAALRWLERARPVSP